MLIAMVPRRSVRFLGNWNVMGLRATGSYDFEVPEQVIPADFVHDPAYPRVPRGGALYRMGMMALPCISHGAFAIGTTRRALHEWTRFARVRRGADGRTLADRETFHRDIALAEAEARAAEAWLRTTFDRIFAAAGEGAVPEDLRLDGRLATSHAFVVAMRVAQRAYAACTTTPLRNGHPLQRVFPRHLRGQRPLPDGRAVDHRRRPRDRRVEGAAPVF
uniref:acyl-CoA dehydrogenase family protein n=1 Tax=Paenibacillus abyssi TaxID=1340531 RepID=UPI00366DBCD2